MEVTQDRIREAALSDAEAIWHLNSASLGYGYAPDDTRRRLERILALEGNRVLVFERGDRVLGYIHAADYECCYVDSLKDILALAVEPDAQGQGVGRALLGAAEDWARSCGCAGVRLNSGMERVGAHRFYEACGYANRKDQKNYIKRFCAD